MYGYATNENDAYMPSPIYYAHKLSKKLEEVRRNGVLPYLLPDGKTQVTLEYENDTITRIDTIVISNQHTPEVSLETLQDDIKREVIEAELGDLVDANTTYHINPTGKFEIGGPK